MRRVILKTIGLSVVFALVLSLGLMSPGMVMAGQNKVDVCHVPPGNPENFHTITISENALPAHLAHGDFEGACNANCAALCDDGNACTIDDTGDCSEVGCPLVPEPVDCNDSDPNTADSCEPSIGCINTPLCGNGVIDGAEACDDGNTVDGDGCSAVCTVEAPSCPCEGITNLNYTWDDTFATQAGRCFYFGDTLIIEQGEIFFFERLFVGLGLGPMVCGWSTLGGQIEIPVTQAEDAACRASLVQIAANDGVTCP